MYLTAWSTIKPEMECGILRAVHDFSSNWTRQVYCGIYLRRGLASISLRASLLGGFAVSGPSVARAGLSEARQIATYSKSSIQQVSVHLFLSCVDSFVKDEAMPAR